MKHLQIVLEAGKARALRLDAGDRVRITNTHGSQVVDSWALDLNEPSTFMSMEHTRVHAEHPTPRLGTVFLTNHRKPILEMTADTSPGIHDWFYAACDRYRYELLGCEGPHDNCTDNFKKALMDEGIDLPFIPCPLNLFENVPLVGKGSMVIEPPAGRPGDYVELTALTKVLVIFSACPQDMVPTNGKDMTPKPVGLEVLRS